MMRPTLPGRCVAHLLLIGFFLLGFARAAAQQPFHRAAAPHPPPGTIFLYPERVPVEDGRLVEAERGVLYVPMNRADTARGVVSVEVWRFRARGPDPGPPVFRLPGGPGFEGLEEDVSEPAFHDNAVDFYTRFGDYVVVGQRGIGASKPNTLCDDVEDGPAEYSRRCRAYWESKGLDRTGFTVIEAAADVADVARALGYDRVMIRGGSFGSHWAMAVMRYHPGLVVRALLSGLEGPDHTYDHPAGLLNSLRRIASAAAGSEALTPFIPDGGIIGALKVVRERLEERPATVTLPDPETGEERSLEFTAADIPGWATGYTGYVGDRDEARSWPADILRLYYGDFTGVAERRLERQARPREWDPDLTASQDLLDCASGISPGRLEAIRTDPARALVWEDASWYQELCGPWEVDVGDDFRLGFRTPVPTVLVHGTWDVSTPFDNALELAPLFERGKLVSVVGGTHGALGEAFEADPGFRDAVEAFLATGDLSAVPDSVVLPPLEWTVPPELRELVGEGGASSP